LPYQIKKKLRSVLFWAIMQPGVVIPYGCFGTTYTYHLQGLTDRLFWNVNKQLPLHTA